MFLIVTKLNLGIVLIVITIFIHQYPEPPPLLLCIQLTEMVKCKY